MYGTDYTLATYVNMTKSCCGDNSATWRPRNCHTFDNQISRGAGRGGAGRGGAGRGGAGRGGAGRGGAGRGGAGRGGAGRGGVKGTDMGCGLCGCIAPLLHGRQHSTEVKLASIFT